MTYVGKVLATLILVFSALTVNSIAIAQERINTLERADSFSYEVSGVAIRGYDTVAYFTQSTAIRGSELFTTQWEGATWRFVSAKNLRLFKKDPEKYAPQYGGYCAYAVAKGGLAKIEAQSWSIINGKLYLNYDNTVQRLWQKNIAGFIGSADDNFESLLQAN